MFILSTKNSLTYKIELKKYIYIYIYIFFFFLNSILNVKEFLVERMNVKC